MSKLSNIRGVTNKIRRIIYVVVEEDKADSLSKVISDLDGVISVETSIYSNNKFKEWDLALNNDRFCLTIITDTGEYQKIKDLIGHLSYHRLEVSDLPNSQIITIIGDLPDQLKFRKVLEDNNYEYKINNFTASTRTKTYKCE